MTSERPSTTTLLIIALLLANLGVSAYIALRPPAVSVGESSREVSTSAIAAGEASNLAKAIIALYNAKNITALYDRFDPLAKVQFTPEKFAEQMEKLGPVIGHIDDCAYSHATTAGTQGGRTYYVLHYKVSLSGTAFSTGDLTITVTRNPEGLGLFGFFINGVSGQRSS